MTLPGDARFQPRHRRRTTPSAHGSLRESRWASSWEFPSPVADMWLWHAAEETEHKSVCFEAYCSALGKGPMSYIYRVIGMLFATPLFLFVMMTAGAIALGLPRGASPHGSASPQIPAVEAAASDPPAGSPGAERFIGRSILGLLWEGVPWRLFFSYYRPSFHPWDHDNTNLIAAWKERYPGFGGTRTES